MNRRQEPVWNRGRSHIHLTSGKQWAKAKADTKATSLPNGFPWELHIEWGQWSKKTNALLSRSFFLLQVNALFYGLFTWTETDKDSDPFAEEFPPNWSMATVVLWRNIHTIHKRGRISVLEWLLYQLLGQGPIPRQGPESVSMYVNEPLRSLFFAFPQSDTSLS